MVTRSQTIGKRNRQGVKVPGKRGDKESSLGASGGWGEWWKENKGGANRTGTLTSGRPPGLLDNAARGRVEERLWVGVEGVCEVGVKRGHRRREVAMGFERA